MFEGEKERYPFSSIPTSLRLKKESYAISDDSVKTLPPTSGLSCKPRRLSGRFILSSTVISDMGGELPLLATATCQSLMCKQVSAQYQ